VAVQATKGAGAYCVGPTAGRTACLTLSCERDLKEVAGGLFFLALDAKQQQ